MTTPPPHPASPVSGFTLVETLVTIAILSVLIALAGPSFRDIQQRWEVQSTAQAMESSLTLARSEAIRRAGKVALRQASTACTPGGWSCGWVVFSDQDGDGAQSSTEPVLQSVELSGAVQVVHGSNATAMRLDRYGVVVGASSFNFAFSPAKGGSGTASQRILCVSQGWRIKTLEGTECK